jgi:hypothetical protein
VSPGAHTPGHSPLHHPYYQHATPHGLPPITPTMPPFTFIPQPSPGDWFIHSISHSLYSCVAVYQMLPSRGYFASAVSAEDSTHGAEREKFYPHNANSRSASGARPRFAGQMHSIPLPTPPLMPPFGYPLSTPPLHAHSHPVSQMFTPLSPGALWGGGSVNPYINPAVGQPVRMGYTGTPGDVFLGTNAPSGFTNITPGGDNNRGANSNSARGYFDLGYFPPVTTSEMRNVSEEIMKPKSESDSETTEKVESEGASQGDPAVSGTTSAPQNTPLRTFSESAGNTRPTELCMRKENSDPVPTAGTWQVAPASSQQKLNDAQDQESCA